MGRTSKNPIPIEVIKAAVDGDSDALDMVCNTKPISISTSLPESVI